MTNADKFKEVFGLYATELWAKSEKEFLDWLNSDVPETNVGDMISRQAAIEGLADEVVGGLEKIKAGYGNDWLGGMHTAWRVLDDLPSTQSEKRTDKHTETHECDLISRQAAIDAIEEYADRLQMVNWKENPNVPYKVHSLNWCINTIRDLPSAQQWIPVTKRLPDPYSGEYLVTINDGSVYTDILWFDSPGDGRYESCFYKTDADGYGVACDDVIAWMPLPEAYKGENDG